MRRSHAPGDAVELIELSGVIGFEHTEALAAILDGCENPVTVIDVRQLTSLDPLAVELLGGAARRAHRASRHLHVVPGPPAAQAAFEATDAVDRLAFLDLGSPPELESGPGAADSTPGELVEGSERGQRAERRDFLAWLRDRFAEARDRTAERRPPSDLTGREESPAAEDRQHAADDRTAAGGDRTASAADRAHASQALADAHRDDLTGVYRRGLGTDLVEREIQRSRRLKAPLAIAVIDVDDLKHVNDTQGHAAGDDLLAEVADTLRSHLRPYDPIVRFGGDEFLCALLGADLAEADARFDRIRRAVSQAASHGSISVGTAQLRGDDTLAQVWQRGDEALYRDKSRRRSSRQRFNGRAPRQPDRAARP